MNQNMDFFKLFAEGAPYFLALGAGMQHTTSWQIVETIVGMVLHIALWTVVVVLDCLLLRDKFDDWAHAYYHALMLGAFVTVVLAACVVVFVTAVHWLAAACKCNFSFNDGYLPSFATSLILGNIRASHTFTMLLLLIACITNTDATDDVIDDTWTRNALIVQFVLKQVGISFTANAHRFAVKNGHVASQ